MSSAASASVSERERLAAAFGGQPLGPFGSVSATATSSIWSASWLITSPVVLADHPGADHGEPESLRRIRSCVLDPLVLQQVGEGLPSPAEQCPVRRTRRARRPVSRCGSREKNPSKPSWRSARMVSATSPSPSPAGTTVPSAAQRVLDLDVLQVRAQGGVPSV